MKNKRKLLIVLIIIFVIINLIFLIINFPLPCDYENHAWGVVKRTCECIGLKTLTSHGYADEGISYGCVGIPINNKCYTGSRGDPLIEWKEVDCNEK